jgi:hypothetical protein
MMSRSVRAGEATGLGSGTPGSFLAQSADTTAGTPAPGGAPAEAPRAARDTAAASPPILREGIAAPGRRRQLTRWEQPKWVMFRSLALPGWGQFHNRAWLKAIGIAAGEGTLIYKLYDDRRDLDALERAVEAARAAGEEDLEDVLVTEYNSRLDSYVGRQWLLGGLVAFAMLDAYIDAHFRSFNVEFEGDPALPGGVPPSRKLRLSVGWRF